MHWGILHLLSEDANHQRFAQQGALLCYGFTLLDVTEPMNGFIAQRQRNTPRKHWSPKERYQTVVKLQQQLARASSSGECRLNDANNVLYRVKYKDALLQGTLVFIFCPFYVLQIGSVYTFFSMVNIQC